MAGKKGIKHYPTEVKLEAVRIFLKKWMTRSNVAAAPGQRSDGRVKTSVKQSLG